MPIDRQHQGFTLLEVMVALVIFAVLGVLTILGLHAVLRTHQQLTLRNEQLQQVAITMALLRRDAEQVIDRTVLDAGGSHLPAVSVGGDGNLAWTTSGLVNPLGIQRRGDMERVDYRLQGQRLERWTWPALDRAPNTRPIKQVLLNHVTQMSIHCLTADNRWVVGWPSTMTEMMPPSSVNRDTASLNNRDMLRQR